MATSKRWAAFLAPPPADWIPVENERVYVRHGYVSTAYVKYFQAPDFVRLLYRYRGIRTKNYYQGFEKTMQIEDIRPVLISIQERKRMNQLLESLIRKTPNALPTIEEASKDRIAIGILADLADDNELGELSRFLRYTDKFYSLDCFLDNFVKTTHFAANL